MSNEELVFPYRHPALEASLIPGHPIEISSDFSIEIRLVNVEEKPMELHALGLFEFRKISNMIRRVHNMDKRFHAGDNFSTLSHRFEVLEITWREVYAGVRLVYKLKHLSP